MWESRSSPNLFKLELQLNKIIVAFLLHLTKKCLPLHSLTATEGCEKGKKSKNSIVLKERFKIRRTAKGCSEEFIEMM